MFVMISIHKKTKIDFKHDLTNDPTAAIHET